MGRIEDEIEGMFAEQYLDPETEFIITGKEFNYCEWYVAEISRFIQRRKLSNLRGGKKPSTDMEAEGGRK